MSDLDDAKMDELIREIALRNGVAVSRRDPIMVVHTMNNQLLKEGKAAQQEVLNTFKSELEGIAHQWGEEAKIKAEKVLNAALSASKEAMVNSMQEGSKRASEEISKALGESVEKIEAAARSARRAAYTNLAASALIVLALTALMVM